MSVTIKIEGDLTYEGQTSVLKAAQIIAFLNVQAASDSAPSGEHKIISAGPFSLEGPVRPSGSPREFLLASQASTYPEKITALGKYISDRNDTQTFSAKELQETFRRAGERLPGNLGRDLAVAVALGLIASEGPRGDYYVTNLGLDQVEGKFATTSSIPRSTARTSRTKGSRAGLSENIEALAVEPHLKGYPSYWDATLKENKSLRILWLLEFASKAGVTELSAADINRLAKLLSDDIQIGSIPSKAIGLTKKGYITKTADGRFRILKPGSEFLTTMINS